MGPRAPARTLGVPPTPKKHGQMARTHSSSRKEARSFSLVHFGQGTGRQKRCPRANLPKRRRTAARQPNSPKGTKNGAVPGPKTGGPNPVRKSLCKAQTKITGPENRPELPQMPGQGFGTCLAMLWHMLGKALAHASHMFGNGKLWQMLGNGTPASGASPRLAWGRRNFKAYIN